MTIVDAVDDYDVEYDPNDVDNGYVTQVRCSAVRAGAPTSVGSDILCGDGEEPPVLGTILANDGTWLSVRLDFSALPSTLLAARQHPVAG